ncbi:MAG: hypothetical protein U9Q94_05930 [Candidatus Bipolaricaulota bacterium]|nr:hypothetical protein [Candidatus Bipolaricaulota bacterium]
MQKKSWVKGHKRALIAIVVAMVVTSLVGLVLADQQSVTVRLSWTVLPFQELRIAGSAGHGSSVTADYVMSQPDALDLQQGYLEEMNSVDLTVNSNIPWKVQVWTESSDMGESNDTLVTKPISDFELREHGSSYFSISKTPQILTSGSRGSFDIGVDHRILLGSDYRPGNYGLEIVYTIMPK